MTALPIDDHPEDDCAILDDEPATGDALVSVLIEENGKWVTHYFNNEADARAAITDEAVQRALEMEGAWSDLDWDEMIDALDAIRHSSPPTPPMDELLADL